MKMSTQKTQVYNNLYINERISRSMNIKIFSSLLLSNLSSSLSVFLQREYDRIQHSNVINKNVNDSRDENEGKLCHYKLSVEFEDPNFAK